jgi:hypothetical protein
MAKGKRAKRAKNDMGWRLDLIRESHHRILAAKATEIETQQKQAKRTRTAERKRAKKQEQVAIYITAILVRQDAPVAAHAVA